MSTTGVKYPTGTNAQILSGGTGTWDSTDPATIRAAQAADGGTTSVWSKPVGTGQTSPGLEVWGFDTSGVPSDAIVTSVKVELNEFVANTSRMAAFTYELWNGTTAKIGNTQTGTNTNSSSNIDTYTFTGVTYSQLSTLRVRTYGHGGGTSTASTGTVDFIRITVEYYVPAQVTETDTPYGGTPSSANPVSVTGTVGTPFFLLVPPIAKAKQTSHAQIGTPVTLIVPSVSIAEQETVPIVQGNQVTETETANTGTAVVIGSQVTETETINTGIAYIPPPVAGFDALWDASTIVGQSDSSIDNSVPDLSTSGYTLVGGVGGGPTYYKTTSAKLMNGLPVLQFDDVGDTLVCSSFHHHTTPFTIALAIRLDATDGGKLVMDQSLNFFTDISGTEWRMGAVSVIHGPVPTIGSHVIIFIYDGASSRLIVDNQHWDGDTGTLNGGISNGFQFGDYMDTLLFTLGQGINWPFALNESEQNTIFNFLTQKWIGGAFGTQAVETETAYGGGISLSGSQVTETETANAGEAKIISGATATVGTPLTLFVPPVAKTIENIVIHGAQAVETETANAGSLPGDVIAKVGTPIVITILPVSEAEQTSPETISSTAQVGTPVIQMISPIGEGEVNEGVVGSQVEETDYAQAGSLPGSVVAEVGTPFSMAILPVAIATQYEPDVVNAIATIGTPIIITVPSMGEAEAFDIVYGAQVSETETAQVGSIGGETTLEIQSASHQVSSEAPTLTQLHILVVQSDAHVLSSPNLDIVVGLSLTLESTTHELSSQNISLGQLHLLTVQSDVHSVASGNIDLGYNVFNLVVQSDVHNTASSAPTLERIFNLVVQSAVEAISSPEIVLVRVIDIVVQSAVNSLSSTNAVLVRVVIMALDNTSHSTASSNIELTQLHVLVVANTTDVLSSTGDLVLQVGLTLVVANTNDALGSPNLTLGQLHLLAVDNSSEVLSSSNISLVRVILMSVNGAVNTITSSNPSLTQLHILVVSNTVNSLSSSNVDLTISGFTLTVQNAADSLTSSSPTLQRYFNLVVQSATDNHSVSSLVLQRVIFMVVQSAVNNHSVSSVILERTFVLEVQSAQDILSSDLVVLERIFNLDVQDAKDILSDDFIRIISIDPMVLQSTQHAFTSTSLLRLIQRAKYIEASGMKAKIAREEIRAILSEEKILALLKHGEQEI